MDIKQLVKDAQAVKASGGNKGDLLAMYVDPKRDDETQDAFEKREKTASQNLTQALTNLRRDLRERLMTAKGMSEEDAKAAVIKIVPVFRENRMTANKAVIDDIFGELLAGMDESIGEDDELEDDFGDIVA